MPRIYIDKYVGTLERTDLYLVKLTMKDGTVYEDLEPRRLFPLSGLDKYITLLDEEGIEKAVIRDLTTLPPQEREIIESCLAESYLIPKVTKIYGYKEKYGILTLDTETDRGPAQIEIRNLLYGLKLVYGKRVLMRDSSDNRFEIPDIDALDKQSRQNLDCFL